MNKLYDSKRRFFIHSRHMSQRQTPSTIDNLLKRHQSANRISRANIQEANSHNILSREFMEKRNSANPLTSINSNCRNRPMIKEI